MLPNKINDNSITNTKQMVTLAYFIKNGKPAREYGKNLSKSTAASYVSKYTNFMNIDDQQLVQV